ncbi:mucin 2 precursor [Lachnospiraceae bacterium KM106-2]|nr:mucin 2 precursor [Lachnospiraceae bacterium KM106-2]
MNKIKESFQGKKFKNGAYSSAIMLVVLVIVLIFNLIVNKFDWKVDLSQDGMYTLTSDTKKVVSGIKDKIKLYYIVENGSEASQIEEIINKYGNLSDKITVVKKDPVVYPKFTSSYVDSSETVADNSVIVVNETNKKYKYVPYDDMLVSEVDYSTYQSSVTAIDVEGQITSALQYVTSEDMPKLYQVTGHNEVELGTSMTKAVEKQNVTIEELKTLTEKSIPSDCDILLINGPTTDFTDDETTMIKKYLQNGGKAILVSAYTTENMSNFNSILEYYGVKTVDGIVIEDSDHSVNGYTYYTLPEVQSLDWTSDITKPVVMIHAQGLQKTDTRSTVSMESILTTSDNAYAAADTESSTTSKSDKDIDGPFDLGVYITEKYNKKETKLAVYSSAYFVDENSLNLDNTGNQDLFLKTIQTITDKEAGLSIPERSVATTYLTVSGSQTTMWTIILVIVLPVICLFAGFMIWYRRRRR